VDAEKLKSKQKSTNQTMKRSIILTAVLCFYTLSVTEAQINKGRMLIGASTSFSSINFGSDLMSLGFTSLKQKSNATGYVEPAADKMTTINLLPKVGYFIINNLALGVEAFINSYSEKYGSDGSTSSMIYFGLGPFARYYMPGSKIMPFFEINSLFGSMDSKYKSTMINYSDKSGVTSVGGGVGIAVKLGDKVTFDMMAGYNSISEKAKQNNPNNERIIQGTISFRFGFIVLLGSK